MFQRLPRDFLDGFIGTSTHHFSSVDVACYLCSILNHQVKRHRIGVVGMWGRKGCRRGVKNY